MTGYQYGGPDGATYGGPDGSAYGTPLPRQVDNLSVDTTRFDEIDLSWDAGGSADEYAILRSEVSGTDTSGYTEIGTATTTEFTDTGLTNGRSYYYRIVGRNEVGDGPLSAEASGTTALPAPTIDSLDNSSERQITVEWTLEDDNDDGDLEIFRDGALIATISELSTTSYTDSDSILDGEQYEYYLERDTGDASADSDAETVVSYLPDGEGLDIDASQSGELTPQWDAVLNNGQYRVQLRDDDPDGDHPEWGEDGEATVSYDAAGLEHTFGHLLDGEQYSIRLRTETGYVTGEWLSAEEITKITASGDVGFGTVTETSVSVTWTDDADFDGSYQIYRRRQNYDYDGPGRLIGTVAATDESFTDDTAQPGHEYEFIIRARTAWVHADSEPAIVTTDGIGLEQRVVPPRGWHVEIDHPSGQTLTPQILDDSSRRPTVNGFPRVEISTPYDDKWHSTSFDDATLRVWLDGSRLPIEILEHRSLEEGSGNKRTVLEGRGGTQLDRRVIEDVEIQPTHEFVRDLLEEYTSYTINVDDSDVSQEERLLQAAETDSEHQQAIGEIPDDTPVEVVQEGRVAPLQTSWLAEGEATGSPSASESTFNADLDGYSGGEAAVIEDLASNNVTLTLESEYTIPGGAGTIAVRNDRGDGDTPVTVNVLFDGEVLQGGNDVPLSSSLGWTTFDVSDEISPDEHTVTIEHSNGNDQPQFIDVVAFYDDRFDHTLDNGVHESGGYLDGPEPYPDLARVELEAITTPLAITNVTLDVESDDGNGLAELGIGVDGTDTYDTVTDALTHTLEYSELSTTARARIAVGRDDSVTRDDQTPRTGFEPRSLESLELRAVLDDTPVLTNRSFDGRAMDVLQEVFDIGNFVSEIRADGEDTIIEVTQIGQREADVDPDLADYSIDRQTEDVVERAIIYGGAQRITRQSVDVAIGEWIDLPFPDSRLVEGKETIYEGEAEFERGSDYEIRYTTRDGQPQLMALQEGDLEDGQTVRVDADVKPRGEFVQGDVVDEEDARTIIEDIPGLASKQMCDQVALYLVEETGEAITDVSITVPHDSVEWSVIEAIDPARLPDEGPYQVRDIDHSVDETTVQLGRGQSGSEAVNDIRNRISRNSERV